MQAEFSGVSSGLHAALATRVTSGSSHRSSHHSLDRRVNCVS
jgi:hypothetical protein